MPVRRTPTCTARHAATWVVDQLAAAGHRALFAGGCVRDRIMGGEPKDYDVATDAPPDAVAAVFPRAQRVGEAFGVMLVRRHGHTVEVATFREDGPYVDGRRPESVAFCGPRNDSQRRDFTINGLFEEPGSGAVIDYVGGQADLAEGVIRAIGVPADRFREDRLRLLRAVRFAARFGFVIEPATAAAIREHAGELAGVSRERIGQEIRWMLDVPTRTAAVGLLQQLGLDGAVLDELPIHEARGERPLSHLAGLPPAAEYPAVLAAWLLDRHDVPAGTDLAGARGREETDRGAARWTRALMLSNQESRSLADCLHLYEVLRFEWQGLPVAARKRRASGPAFGSALDLVRSTDPERGSTIAEAVAELSRSDLAPEPFLSGHDLIEVGLQPGPRFRRILDLTYDAQLEGRIGSRDEALGLAHDAMRAGSDGEPRPTENA